MTRLQKQRIYDQYLKTDHWTAVRESALARAGYRCQACARLHGLGVHHNSYENLTYEAAEDLMVLCERCHAIFHEVLPMANLIDYARLVDFVALNPDDTDQPEDASLRSRCANCGAFLKAGMVGTCGPTCTKRLALRNERGY